MRRLAVVLVLVLAGMVWPATSGLAHRSTTTQAAGGLQADFNNDGFADLAVGVWGENVGGAANGGAVNVLYGTAAGLTGIGSQFLTQDSPGVPGVVEPDDEFAFALGAGDFNRDRFADLAVGAPGEDFGADDRGGVVNVLRGSAGGLTGSGSQLFTQDSPGVPDSVEFDDFFGEALPPPAHSPTAASTSPPSHWELRPTAVRRSTS